MQFQAVGSWKINGVICGFLLYSSDQFCTFWDGCHNFLVYAIFYILLSIYKSKVKVWHFLSLMVVLFLDQRYTAPNIHFYDKVLTLCERKLFVANCFIFLITLNAHNAVGIQHLRPVVCQKQVFLEYWHTRCYICHHHLFTGSQWQNEIVYGLLCFSLSFQLQF